MKKNRLLCLVVLLGGLCTLGIGSFYLNSWANWGLVFGTGNINGEIAQENGIAYKQSLSDKKELVRLKEPLNILIIGIDRASSINGPPRPKPWRSDVIILAHIDPNVRQVNLLSIPRDTRVNIIGRGMDKINSAYAYGEISLAQRVVKEYLGLEVDHYICIDYTTFSRMVDIMGGIEIDVKNSLKTKHFDFEPGSQIMNGQQAYVYITDRSEPMADISRIDRQQQFLIALFKNIKYKAGTMDLAKIYVDFIKSAETSLTLSDALKLALFAQDLRVDDLVLQTLPGQPVYIDHISYWIVDEDVKKQLVAEMFGE